MHSETHKKKITFLGEEGQNSIFKLTRKFRNQKICQNKILGLS